MIKGIIKIAIRSFLLCATIFCIVGQIQADELSIIKDGCNSYLSKIKDGKGSCTLIQQYFEPDNLTVPKGERKDSFLWKFAGSKIRCKKMNVSITGGWPAQKESDYEIYFNGQEITAGEGKAFVLRKPGYLDFSATNEWDPRLVVTGSTRPGKDWEPVTFWDKIARTLNFVGKEEINGHECYVLETTTEKDLEKNGGMTRRSWFDIERNYCLVRIEEWISTGKNQPIWKGREWIENAGKYLSSRTDIELKEYGKDLWGPKKYEFVQYVPDSKTKTFCVHAKIIRIYDDNCTYNSGIIEDDLKISPPPDATVFNASEYPTDYVKPTMSIEFRTTSSTPLTNFTQVNAPDTNEKVYISDKAEITEVDISGIKISFEMQGLPSLDIWLTDNGLKKLGEMTQNHINERMAVFMSGKLFTLPVIKEKIRAPRLRLQMSNRLLTEKEFKRIVSEVKRKTLSPEDTQKTWEKGGLKEGIVSTPAPPSESPPLPPPPPPS